MSNGAAASEHGERVPRRPGHSAARAAAPISPTRRPDRAGQRDRQPAALGSGFAARVFGLLGISMGVHMALLAVLGFMPSPVALLRQQVEMEIASTEPEPPPPPPPPAAEPPKAQEPPSRPKAAPKAVPKPAATPEPPAEPKVADEAPVDLTGVTLTGGDGASWSSVVGNGAQLKGPAGRIGKVPNKDKAGDSNGVVGSQGTAPVVSEASLSRKPIPPEGMNDLLVQYYPPRARAQGVAGSALLRVRILADGQVAKMKLIRESDDYGFGEACMKLLRLRRWQAPLDRRGMPVATEISYVCEFEVGY